MPRTARPDQLAPRPGLPPSVPGCPSGGKFPREFTCDGVEVSRFIDPGWLAEFELDAIILD